MSLLHTSAPVLQTSKVEPKRLRLAYFVSHPIQYQAPLLKKVAALPDLDLQVFFFSDFSVRSYKDEGFGVAVNWDIPLTEGYNYEFLPTYRNSGGLSFADPLCRGIFKRLEQGNFDAIWLHAYHTLNNLHVLMAAKMLQIPLLLRAESTLIDRPRSKSKLIAKDLFFTLLRPTISGLLTISRANSSYWNKYLPDIPQFSMPYTVDNDFFREMAQKAAPQREQFRQSLQLEPERPVILFASKLQQRKRCIDLLEAYLQLSAEKPASARPYLLIVGDGEERAALEARIAATNSAADIRMLGFKNQTELPRYFDLCDVFVLPSVHEPYGLVVNEVMNAGRPVIVTDEVGCSEDLIQHGVNGMVFKAGNAAELARAIDFVLASPERTRSMGEQALSHIRKFDFERDITGLRSALRFITT